MPDVYLAPADLDLIQAQRVLDFLNRATGAQQLAGDIEFPGEPDIGVKLGQRLLDARAALGGSFTSLLQVRAVRLIGPERFTEICIAALGLAPDRWVELFYAGAPNAPQAENGLALSLDLHPQPAWLGQPLALTVRVADQGGTPRAGVAVAVYTGAGRLTWMFGFQRIVGQAVTVITGADGSAVLDLEREPSEPLSELHQAALETALAQLDAKAMTPLDLQADFRALAQVYLHERSTNLRRAIDLHVRDHRAAMIDSLNPGAWRLAWPVDSVLLQADALAPQAGGTAVARAVTTLHWKNWVGAWLEFFADVLRERGNLDARFAAAARAGADADVLSGLLAEAQGFVIRQPGETAQWLGRKTVDAAVARVMGSDLVEQMQPAARNAMLTQLEAAARDVSPTTLGSFTLVSNARKDIVGKIGALDLGQIGALQRAEELLGAMQGEAQRVSELAAQVDRQSAQVGRDVASFDAGRAQLDNRLIGLQTNVSTLQLDFSRIAGPGRSAPPATTPAPPTRKRAPRKKAEPR